MLTIIRNVIIKIQSILKYSINEVLKEIKKILDNVDTFDVDMKIKSILVNENILTYVIPNRISTLPKDFWIGKFWSWQIPIYYYIFKAFYEKGIYIDVNDFLKFLS